jgi:predicted HTH transcriptional regulator
MRLEDVLRQPEGKRLEFKRDLSSPLPVLRSLVAFANTAGGRVVIGVTDRSHDVVGVADPLALEQRLANLIADGISPRLIPEVEFLSWRNTQVLVVDVHLGEGRPYHLVSEGEERGVYVRLGSTNRRADEDLIAEMRRSVSNRSFDEEPLSGLDSEAVDFAAASELFRGRRVLRRSDMTSLGWLRWYEGRTVPTVGGLLLFGRDRLAEFPDAWCQAGRFAGTTRVSILDTVDLTGTLPELVDGAIAFVERHLSTGVVIEGVRHRQARTLPLVAVREAVINAVVHADYSQRGAPIRVAVFDDRVEIESPGLLPFGMSIEDMRAGVSRVRNRVLARAFKELGYIEQWGSGIPRMTDACRRMGLPDPNIEEIAGRVRVTLDAVATGSAVVDDLDRVVLDRLAMAGGMTTAEVASVIDRTTRATRTRLLSLLDRGLVVEIGSGPNDPKRRYFLPAHSPTDQAE